MRMACKIGGLIIVLLTIAGCAFPYYMQAISGQIGLLSQRVPIHEVIADPNVDPTTRARLELVTELRRFSVSRLGLPENKSYTSYVDLGRDYVVWNVVATDEFSVKPRTWCFPVAGCVSYRGYFKRARADAFAKKLGARGYDTFAVGSPAYSTLGHFDDPVLNTMLNRRDVDIAATLFHELAHQQVYIKGDTELSESFATAVEQHGVEAWLMSRGEHDALAQYRSRLERQQRFAELVARQRARLRTLFRSDIGEAEMRRQKAASFDAMRSEYEDLKSDWGGSADYDFWFADNLNNASLVALTSYLRWVPALRARLDRLGPTSFYEEVEALTKLDRGQRAAILQSWETVSALTALTDSS